jgi:hypothetical protein
MKYEDAGAAITTSTAGVSGAGDNPDKTVVKKLSFPMLRRKMALVKGLKI